MITAGHALPRFSETVGFQRLILISPRPARAAAGRRTSAPAQPQPQGQGDAEEGGGWLRGQHTRLSRGRPGVEEAAAEEVRRGGVMGRMAGLTALDALQRLGLQRLQSGLAAFGAAAASDPPLHAFL